ncbi:MAG: hypothetical protein HY984_00025 [Candidatus Magasanikbacteria bacterium]|nr:hypothetical protein [Candidatus Magasanikbacteria bacterium]
MAHGAPAHGGGHGHERAPKKSPLKPKLVPKEGSTLYTNTPRWALDRLGDAANEIGDILKSEITAAAEHIQKQGERLLERVPDKTQEELRTEIEGVSERLGVEADRLSRETDSAIDNAETRAASAAHAASLGAEATEQITLRAQELHQRNQANVTGFRRLRGAVHLVVAKVVGSVASAIPVSEKSKKARGEELQQAHAATETARTQTQTERQQEAWDRLRDFNEQKNKELFAPVRRFESFLKKQYNELFAQFETRYPGQLPRQARVREQWSQKIFAGFKKTFTDTVYPQFQADLQKGLIEGCPVRLRARKIRGGAETIYEPIAAAAGNLAVVQTKETPPTPIPMTKFTEPLNVNFFAAYQELLAMMAKENVIDSAETERRWALAAAEATRFGLAAPARQTQAERQQAAESQAATRRTARESRDVSAALDKYREDLTHDIVRVPRTGEEQKALRQLVSKTRAVGAMAATGAGPTDFQRLIRIARETYIDTYRQTSEDTRYFWRAAGCELVVNNVPEVPDTGEMTTLKSITGDPDFVDNLHPKEILQLRELLKKTYDGHEDDIKDALVILIPNVNPTDRDGVFINFILGYKNREARSDITRTLQLARFHADLWKPPAAKPETKPPKDKTSRADFDSILGQLTENELYAWQSRHGIELEGSELEKYVNRVEADLIRYAAHGAGVAPIERRGKAETARTYTTIAGLNEAGFMGNTAAEDESKKKPRREKIRAQVKKRKGVDIAMKGDVAGAAKLPGIKIRAEKEGIEDINNLTDAQLDLILRSCNFDVSPIGNTPEARLRQRLTLRKVERAIELGQMETSLRQSFNEFVRTKIEDRGQDLAIFPEITEINNQIIRIYDAQNNLFILDNGAAADREFTTASRQLTQAAESLTQSLQNLYVLSDEEALDTTLAISRILHPSTETIDTKEAPRPVNLVALLHLEGAGPTVRELLTQIASTGKKQDYYSIPLFNPRRPLALLEFCHLRAILEVTEESFRAEGKPNTNRELITVETALRHFRCLVRARVLSDLRDNGTSAYEKWHRIGYFSDWTADITPPTPRELEAYKTKEEADDLRQRLRRTLERRSGFPQAFSRAELHLRAELIREQETALDRPLTPQERARIPVPRLTPEERQIFIAAPFIIDTTTEQSQTAVRTLRAELQAKIDERSSLPLVRHLETIIVHTDAKLNKNQRAEWSEDEQFLAYARSVAERVRQFSTREQARLPRDVVFEINQLLERLTTSDKDATQTRHWLEQFLDTCVRRRTRNTPTPHLARRLEFVEAQVAAGGNRTELTRNLLEQERVPKDVQTGLEETHTRIQDEESVESVATARIRIVLKRVIRGLLRQTIDEHRDVFPGMALNADLDEPFIPREAFLGYASDNEVPPELTDRILRLLESECRVQELLRENLALAPLRALQEQINLTSLTPTETINRVKALLEANTLPEPIAHQLWQELHKAYPVRDAQGRVAAPLEAEEIQLNLINRLEAILSTNTLPIRLQELIDEDKAYDRLDQFATEDAARGDILELLDADDYDMGEADDAAWLELLGRAGVRPENMRDINLIEYLGLQKNEFAKKIIAANEKQERKKAILKEKTILDRVTHYLADARLPTALQQDLRAVVSGGAPGITDRLRDALAKYDLAPRVHALLTEGKKGVELSQKLLDLLKEGTLAGYAESLFDVDSDDDAPWAGGEETADDPWLIEARAAVGPESATRREIERLRANRRLLQTLGLLETIIVSVRGQMQDRINTLAENLRRFFPSDTMSPALSAALDEYRRIREDGVELATDLNDYRTHTPQSDLQLSPSRE